MVFITHWDRNRRIVSADVFQVPYRDQKGLGDRGKGLEPVGIELHMFRHLCPHRTIVVFEVLTLVLQLLHDVDDIRRVRHAAGSGTGFFSRWGNLSCSASTFSFTSPGALRQSRYCSSWARFTSCKCRSAVETHSA